MDEEQTLGGSRATHGRHLRSLLNESVSQLTSSQRAVLREITSPASRRTEFNRSLLEKQFSPEDIEALLRTGLLAEFERDRIGIAHSAITEQLNEILISPHASSAA